MQNLAPEYITGGDVECQEATSTAENKPFFILASNSLHILLDEDYGGKLMTLKDGNENLVPANIPLILSRCLHIADTTAVAILEHHAKQETFTNQEANNGITIGLLGTEPTMREDYLKKQLLKHKGIGKVVVPEDDAVLHQIYQYILHELVMPSKYDNTGKPIFNTETKEFFITHAKKLYYEKGCTGGIVLGCTEIELLLLQEDVPQEIRLFPTALLHITAATHVAAGVLEIEHFLPNDSLV